MNQNELIVAIVIVITAFEIARRHIAARERRETLKLTLAAAEKIASVATAFGQALVTLGNECNMVNCELRDAIQEVAKKTKTDANEIIATLRPPVYRAVMFLVGMIDLIDKLGLKDQLRAATAGAAQLFGFVDPLASHGVIIDVAPIHVGSKAPRLGSA
jgi:hypothetical protein